jgi:hypothetical protein
MPGKGEYTTGITPSGQSKSDKKVSSDIAISSSVETDGEDRCCCYHHVRPASSRKGH